MDADATIYKQLWGCDSVQLEEVPEQNQRRPHSSLASELVSSSLLMTTMGDEEEEAMAREAVVSFGGAWR